MVETFIRTDEFCYLYISGVCSGYLGDTNNFRSLRLRIVHSDNMLGSLPYPVVRRLPHNHKMPK